MAVKVTQKTTKQYEHAYMLVGQFMSMWSILEKSVNEGVGKLLGMEILEEAIATANMQFRSKIHILKAVVHLRCGATDWGKAAIKSIEEAGTLADTWRNIVAHNAFRPHGDGVEFLIIRAKGKLEFPQTIRSKIDFLVVAKRLGSLAERIDDIVAKVAKLKGKLSLSDLIELWPIVGPPPPENGSALSRLLLGSQGSPKSTSEESPRTPQEPEGKDAQ